jgi:hypothetical protein
MVAFLCAIALQPFGIWRELSKFVLYGSLVGGVPYAITAGILLFASYKVELGRLFYLWGIAPFIMTAVAGPVLAVVISLSDAGWSGDGAARFARSWGIFALYSILVGYAYIALAYFLYVCMKALRLIRVEPRQVEMLLAAAARGVPNLRSPDGAYEIVRDEFLEIRMGSPTFASLEIVGSACATAGRSFGEAVRFSPDSRYLAVEELLKTSPPETRAVVFDLRRGSEWVAHVQAPGFIRQLEWEAPSRLSIRAWSHLTSDTRHVWQVPGPG